MKSALTAVGIITAGLLSAPQTPAVFRTETRVVPIYATVTGPDGRLLRNLTQDRFTVLDNGDIRPITTFSAEPSPFRAVALWDVSTASRKHRAQLLPAAAALVETLWQDDLVQFGTFDLQEFALSPLASGDKTTLKRIVNEELWIGTGGGVPVPLWAAMAASLKALERHTGRRVLIILSPGRSENEFGRRDRVALDVQRLDAMVYSVSFDGSGLTSDLRRLASDSGGGYVVLEDDADLFAEFRQIAEELHFQYLIGFVAAVGEARLQSVDVRVNVPGATVRARRMYLAGEP